MKTIVYFFLLCVYPSVIHGLAPQPNVADIVNISKNRNIVDACLNQETESKELIEQVSRLRINELDSLWKILLEETQGKQFEKQQSVVKHFVTFLVGASFVKRYQDLFYSNERPLLKDLSMPNAYVFLHKNLGFSKGLLQRAMVDFGMPFSRLEGFDTAEENTKTADKIKKQHFAAASLFGITTFEDKDDFDDESVFWNEQIFSFDEFYDEDSDSYYSDDEEEDGSLLRPETEIEKAVESHILGLLIPYQLRQMHDNNQEPGKEFIAILSQYVKSDVMIPRETSELLVALILKYREIFLLEDMSLLVDFSKILAFVAPDLREKLTNEKELKELKDVSLDNRKFIFNFERHHFYVEHFHQLDIEKVQGDISELFSNLSVRESIQETWGVDFSKPTRIHVNYFAEGVEKRLYVVELYTLGDPKPVIIRAGIFKNNNTNVDNIKQNINIYKKYTGKNYFVASYESVFEVNGEFVMFGDYIHQSRPTTDVDVYRFNGQLFGKNIAFDNSIGYMSELLDDIRDENIVMDMNGQPRMIDPKGLEETEAPLIIAMLLDNVIKGENLDRIFEFISQHLPDFFQGLVEGIWVAQDEPMKLLVDIARYIQTMPVSQTFTEQDQREKLEMFLQAMEEVVSNQLKQAIISPSDETVFDPSIPSFNLGKIMKEIDSQDVFGIMKTTDYQQITQEIFNAFNVALKEMIQSIQDQNFSKTKQISVEIGTAKKQLTLDVNQWLSGINRIREAA